MTKRMPTIIAGPMSAICGCSETAAMRTSVPSTTLNTISSSSMRGVRRRNASTRPASGRKMVTKGGISAAARLKPCQKA